MKAEQRIPEYLRPLHAALKKRAYTGMDWCKETGSVKLSTRAGELAQYVPVKSEWKTLPSGKKVKSYSC